MSLSYKSSPEEEKQRKLRKKKKPARVASAGGPGNAYLASQLPHDAAHEDGVLERLMHGEEHLQAQEEREEEEHLQAQEEEEEHLQAQEEPEEEEHLQAQEEQEEEEHLQAPEEAEEEEHLQAQEEQEEEEHLQAQEEEEEELLQAQEEQEEEEAVQMKGDHDDAKNARRKARLREAAPDQEVDFPDAIRKQIEQALGVDLSAVRVFVGDRAAAAGAKAYTAGESVHFKPGQYDPHSKAGLELLIHELTHVVQQRAGMVEEFGGTDALEGEADAAARKVLEGQQAAVPAANPPR